MGFKQYAEANAPTAAETALFEAQQQRQQERYGSKRRKPQRAPQPQQSAHQTGKVGQGQDGYLMKWQQEHEPGTTWPDCF